MQKSREELVEELTEYYEAAGFADFYDRALKGQTLQQLEQLYRDTFAGDYRRELMEQQAEEMEGDDRQ